MGFIRNNNVWKINKILAGISGGGVSPEDVQDMIDTSIAPIETAIEGKQDTLTAGENITIDNNVISASSGNGWTETTNDNRTEEFFYSQETHNTVDYLVLKKDVLIRHNLIDYDLIFIPKGTRLMFKQGSSWYNQTTYLKNEFMDSGANHYIGIMKSNNIGGFLKGSASFTLQLDEYAISENNNSGVITFSYLDTGMTVNTVVSYENLQNNTEVSIFVRG